MLDRSKWAQRVVGFLIDNIAILLTIGFAGFVIYRQEVAQVAVSTDELLTAILGILGLLATSEIVERYRKLSRIEKSNNRVLSLLESRVAEHPSATAFFQEPPNYGSYIQCANQIDLCGVTLTATINRQFHNLRERLRAGAKIRVLIINPDSLALQMSTLRSDVPEGADYYHSRLKATFEDLENLYKERIESHTQKGGSSKRGQFSVRLLAYAPSFGIFSFDPNRSNAAMTVGIYPHRSDFRIPPVFELTPKRDGKWYEYFVGQFEEMWRDAKPWEPENITLGETAA